MDTLRSLEQKKSTEREEIVKLVQNAYTNSRMNGDYYAVIAINRDEMELSSFTLDEFYRIVLNAAKNIIKQPFTIDMRAEKKFSAKYNCERDTDIIRINFVYNWQNV